MQCIHGNLFRRHFHLNLTLISPHKKQQMQKGLKKADIYKIQQSKQKLVIGKGRIIFLFLF